MRAIIVLQLIMQALPSKKLLLAINIATIHTSSIIKKVACIVLIKTF